MKKVFIVIPLIVVVVVAVLGVYVLFFQGAKPSGSSSTDTGSVVKCKTVSFIDSEGIGTKAFSMLIPTDWQSEGNIDLIWTTQRCQLKGNSELGTQMAPRNSLSSRIKLSSRLITP